MKEVRLFIPVEPVAQARARATVIWPKNAAMMSAEELMKRCWVNVYDVKKSREYKNAVLRRTGEAIIDSPYRSLFPLDIPLEISITFFITKPKTVTRPYPSITPDLDNYLKAALDALNGVIWTDDARIIRYGDVRKLYAPPGQVPGFKLVVKPCNEAEDFPASQEAMEFRRS